MEDSVTADYGLIAPLSLPSDGRPPGEVSGPAEYATFFQDHEEPNVVTWVYPWRSKEDHLSLLKTEEPLVQPLIEKYCTRPRITRYASELPVEVEHDDHH